MKKLFLYFIIICLLIPIISLPKNTRASAETFQKTMVWVSFTKEAASVYKFTVKAHLKCNDAVRQQLISLYQNVPSCPNSSDGGKTGEWVYNIPKNNTIDEPVYERTIDRTGQAPERLLSSGWEVSVRVEEQAGGFYEYRHIRLQDNTVTNVDFSNLALPGSNGVSGPVATPGAATPGAATPGAATPGASGGTITSTPKGTVDLFFDFDTMFGGTCPDYGCWITKVWAWATMIMLPLSIIMLIAAGALYATSSGNPDRISLAKKIIIGVLSGLVLIVLARVLLINFVGLESTQWNVK